jgi:ornithine--oxo-acid transaminase
LEVLKEEDLAANAEHLGAYFQKQLRALASPLVSEVRGKGLLTAIVFRVAIRCSMGALPSTKKQWLLAKPTHGDKIRFAPPLVITKDQIDECVGIIEKSLSAL